MAKQFMRTLASWGTLAVLLAAILGMRFGNGIALSILVGGFWGLANFFVLAGFLTALVVRRHPDLLKSLPFSGAVFLHPAFWLLVKFPLLYGFVIYLFVSAAVSVIGFGVGFIMVLFMALVVGAMQAAQSVKVASANGS